VEMSSVSLDGFTRQQATELLKNSPNNAVFILERYKQNRAGLVSSLYQVGTERGNKHKRRRFNAILTEYDKKYRFLLLRVWALIRVVLNSN